MKPGDVVIWRYEPRGYGYIYEVPGTVVRVTAKRVVLDVLSVKGGRRRIAVRPEHIRDEPLDLEGE